MYKIILAGACTSALILASAAQAAESIDSSAAAKQAGESSSIDKLVANQPAKPAATSSDTVSDKPMTINFSDFVKDGAGCGVPNLDTSGK
jgi:opacity protein-like surface antigen